MYIFFIVLVVCEQGVCNVVKRLRFAGAVQLNNFTYGSIQNDCSLSYSHESRVPVYKRAFCTSPHSISLSVLHKTGWTLQNVGGYAPQEHQLSWKLGVPLQFFYWKCSLVLLDKFEATKFEHNRAFNLSKSYFRVRGLVESWTGLENCATHLMCYLFIACPWNVSL